jgi:hypothetical protein
MLFQRAGKGSRTVSLTIHKQLHSALTGHADALEPFVPPWVDVLLPAATATVQQMAQVSTAWIVTRTGCILTSRIIRRATAAFGQRNMS